jgi:uncharacterized membrane protein YtjA (UPF0391 family)
MPDFVPRAARIFRPPSAWNHRSQTGIVSAVGRVSRRSKPKLKREVHVMLGWVVTFLIVALVAGVLGFGGVAGASIEIAKIIFFIAVVLFVVSAVVGVARGRRI